MNPPSGTTEAESHYASDLEADLVSIRRVPACLLKYYLVIRARRELADLFVVGSHPYVSNRHAKLASLQDRFDLENVLVRYVLFRELIFR